MLRVRAAPKASPGTRHLPGDTCSLQVVESLGNSPLIGYVRHGDGI